MDTAGREVGTGSGGWLHSMARTMAQSSCHDSHCSDHLQLHTLKGRLRMDAMDNIFLLHLASGSLLEDFLQKIFLTKSTSIFI